MNKVILIGRLTKDPELKYTPGTGNAVCTVTLAVDNPSSKGERSAEFVPVVIWGKQAENTAQYMNKGSQVAISGRITIRSYDAKDGTKRYVTEVVADTYNGISFLCKGQGHSNTGVSNFNNPPADNQFEEVGTNNNFEDFYGGSLDTSSEDSPW